MRILFITGEYPAMQGGVGDYTRCVGQALGALGVEVHVLTRREAGGDHLREPLDAHEPVVHPVLARCNWALWADAGRAIRELRPDVVHVQYQAAAYGMHPAINFWPWRLRLQSARAQIVTTYHDLRVPYLFPKAGPVRWQTVLSLGRGSDAIVVTNPEDWERLDAAGLAARLHAIPIGSNIRCKLPADFDRSAQRAQWQVGPQDWLLAYFGFLNASKGGETLILALSELVKAGDPAHLLMIGGQVGASDPTNTAYLAHIEGLIAELGLGERVHWTGFVAEEQVSANLLAADCAVLPYRDGIALGRGSLMAALLHGLPIISTRPARAPSRAEDSFPRIEHGQSALLAPPDDPPALAAEIRSAMVDAGLRQRLSDGARALACRFGWEAIAVEHLRMYQSLTTGSAG